MINTNNEIWYAEQRDLAIEERDAAITRAEAAEGDLAELRERVADLVHTLHMEQDAHDRLRDQLAAREWRSVTDDWPPYDTPVLARATLVSPVFIAVRERPDNAEYAYVWTDSDGINFYPEEIGYCAAIPTPPQDDDR